MRGLVFLLSQPPTKKEETYIMIDDTDTANKDLLFFRENLIGSVLIEQNIEEVKTTNIITNIYVKKFSSIERLYWGFELYNFALSAVIIDDDLDKHLFYNLLKGETISTYRDIPKFNRDFSGYIFYSLL